MKLKALLLGSAAAMMTVSGAYAADAVVAEPEPMDYVKVCDMYGAGFFYIPGTENCLRMSGYVRVELDYSDFDPASGAPDYDTPANLTTGRINFDVRNETDYGTLQSWIRVEGGSSNATGAIVDTFTVNDVWISLGNLSMGRRDHRATLAALPGGPFDGDDQGLGEAYYVDYTFAANGFSAIVGGGATTRADSGNVYLRADYAGSMYNIAASITHYQTGTGGEQNYNIWGNVTPMEGLTLQGYYNDNSVAGDNSRWGVGASFAVMDNVSIAGGYWETNGGTAANTGYFGQVAWTVAPGLAVTLAAEEKAHATGSTVGNFDETSFRLRVQRSF